MLPQNNLIPFCTWYLVLLPDSSIIRSYFFQIFTPFCTVGNFGKLYVSLVIYDYERICKWSHYLAKQKSRSNKKNYGQIFPRKNMTDKLLLRTNVIIFLQWINCAFYLRSNYITDTKLKYYLVKMQLPQNESAPKR